MARGDIADHERVGVPARPPFFCIGIEVSNIQDLPAEQGGIVGNGETRGSLGIATATDGGTSHGARTLSHSVEVLERGPRSCGLLYTGMDGAQESRGAVIAHKRCKRS